VKNNFHSLHTFISRNTIITLSRDKAVTLIPTLTIGTLVTLITFITIITAIIPMANLLAFQSEQSLLSFFLCGIILNETDIPIYVKFPYNRD